MRDPGNVVDTLMLYNAKWQRVYSRVSFASWLMKRRLERKRLICAVLTTLLATDNSLKLWAHFCSVNT